MLNEKLTITLPNGNTFEIFFIGKVKLSIKIVLYDVFICVCLQVQPIISSKVDRGQ